MSLLSSNTQRRTNLVILSLLLILTISVRIAFWLTTNTTLEDAIITFKYAENLAQGNGFVYNLGEHVLGSTTPLWTIILGALKSVTNFDIIASSKVLGIVFDCSTIAILYFTLIKISNRSIAIFFALLFCTNPDIIMICTSGMETSLLLLGMAFGIFGLIWKNSFFGFGLAIALLTRIDAAIFMGCMLASAIIIEKKWALKEFILILFLALPWFIFSLYYFGNLLPQSLLAKSTVYHQEIALSASSFIGMFTPFNNKNNLKILLNSTLFLFLCAGIVQISKKHKTFIPLIFFFIVYCLIFSVSGILIFRWYLIPPIFISILIVAFGFDWLTKTVQAKFKSKYLQMAVSLIALLLVASNLFITYHRLDKYKQLQGLEDVLRKEIGLWLKQNIQPGSSVLLEPIGYIGYYAGTKINIMDEIGIVTPQIAEYRKTYTGWYCKAIEGLHPDYIIQYKFSLDANMSEGTSTQLFETEDQEKWFFENYQIIKSFKAINSYPIIEEKEKEYVLLKKIYNSIVR